MQLTFKELVQAEPADMPAAEPALVAFTEPVAPAGPVTHRLKCWPEPFAAAKSGIKRHEVRADDRGIQPGDTIVLQEWIPDSQIYTGAELTFLAGYVTRDENWGMPPGLCAFSLLDVHGTDDKDAVHWTPVVPGSMPAPDTRA